MNQPRPAKLKRRLCSTRKLATARVSGIKFMMPIFKILKLISYFDDQITPGKKEFFLNCPILTGKPT